MPGIRPNGKRLLDATSRQQWAAQLDDHVNALAWSPDGAWLAAASVSGPITIFSGHTGQATHVLEGHGFGTCEIGWNVDSSLLASVGQDGKVKLWHPETGEERFSLPGGSAWVEHLAWNPQHNLLATAAGRKLRLWDAATGTLLREYPEHRSTIADIAWKPASNVLTSAAYGSITFWSIDKEEPLEQFEWKGSILTMAWSPDSKHIATGDQDATVHFWIFQSGEDLQMWGYPTKVRELSWNKTGRYMATGGSTTATVWDCSGKGPAGSKPIELKGHANLITALAFQHTGPLIATASSEGKVIIWNIERPRRPLVQADFGSGISQLSWSPDDQYLALGTEGGMVTVCTPPRGK